MCEPVNGPWTEADDVIEEVREIRRRISARFNHDPAKLVEHYMERQNRHGPRLIDRPETKREDASAD
jgi:hypothetical protein